MSACYDDGWVTGMAANKSLPKILFWNNGGGGKGKKASNSQQDQVHVEIGH